MAGGVFVFFTSSLSRTLRRCEPLCVAQLAQEVRRNACLCAPTDSQPPSVKARTPTGRKTLLESKFPETYPPLQELFLSHA